MSESRDQVVRMYSTNTAFISLGITAIVCGFKWRRGLDNLYSRPDAMLAGLDAQVFSGFASLTVGLMALATLLHSSQKSNYDAIRQKEIANGM